MDCTIYYTISLRFPEGIPGKIDYQQNSNELFLSANGKLVAVGRMAHLDSRALAEKFLSSYLPRLQKRYGAGVEVEVAELSAIGRDKRLKRKIEQDSLLARQRLDSGVLAPNFKP